MATRAEHDAPATDDLPTYEDVKAAADRIAGQAVVTPLYESPALNARLRGRILLKAENLQRTGSFKFRGAYNTISQIPVQDRARGVVAYSSGNHAQGVAAAAALVGLPATIVMPEDAPAIKKENTKSYGAEIVLYDRFGESREKVAEELAKDRGATLIRPYDDPNIIAGQGTCGLEIVTQAKALGAAPDAVLICCGGGGLSAGCALALSNELPQAKLYTVEPEGFDDTARSFKTGTRQDNVPGARSFCDALLSPNPGELTFAINKQAFAGGLVVTDTEVAEAMAYAFRSLKLVVEPGGAVTLAALLSGKIDAKGKTIAATLSGGNVDPETFCEVLGRS